MSKTHSLKQWWIPIFALMVALSCSAPEKTATQPPADVGFKETQFALGVQETSVALQQTSMAISNTQKTLQAGTAAADQSIAQTSAAAAVLPTQRNRRPPRNPHPPWRS